MVDRSKTLVDTFVEISAVGLKAVFKLTAFDKVMYANYH